MLHDNCRRLYREEKEDSWKRCPMTSSVMEVSENTCSRVNYLFLVLLELSSSQENVADFIMGTWILLSDFYYLGVYGHRYFLFCLSKSSMFTNSFTAIRKNQNSFHSVNQLLCSFPGESLCSRSSCSSPH